MPVTSPAAASVALFEGSVVMVLEPMAPLGGVQLDPVDVSGFTNVALILFRFDPTVFTNFFRLHVDGSALSAAAPDG